MLDPKILRNEPDKIRQMLKDRGVDFELEKLFSAEKQRREFIVKVDNLRKKRNEMSIQVSSLLKSGKKDEAKKLVEELQVDGQMLTDLELKQKDIEEEYARLVNSIPNLIHETVPRGLDEAANKEIRKWGNVPKFDFQIQDHVDLSDNLDLVDLERAAKVSGARFYYLRNELVRLNQALINFALDFLAEKNYSLVQPPYLINQKSMEGAIIAEDFEDVIYEIKGEGLYLIGTSEHAIAAMHSGEIIEGKHLPIRYAGVSPCFRKEAGAHGKDQKGIFRVHQFEKVEQFVFSRPEESWNEHEKMIRIAEEFYQKLEIPHKVMLLSSGDMAKISAKTYDIEAWMAGQNAYREIVSCSNCLDFQARRLKIRFRDKTNEETQYLHTLNSTLVATSRVLVSIMENFQTRDGHIDIPKVLQSYIGKPII